MITVLLIDDHAAIRQTLQYFIEKSDDIQVLATASSGTEAVAQAISHCPDIIVMDISMPQMDGLEATSLSHFRGRLVLFRLGIAIYKKMRIFKAFLWS